MLMPMLMLMLAQLLMILFKLMFVLLKLGMLIIYFTIVVNADIVAAEVVYTDVAAVVNGGDVLAVYNDVGVSVLEEKI